MEGDEFVGVIIVIWLLVYMLFGVVLVVEIEVFGVYIFWLVWLVYMVLCCEFVR